MYQLPQTLHKTKGNPFFSAGLKKTEGTSSLRLFSKWISTIPWGSEVSEQSEQSEWSKWVSQPVDEASLMLESKWAERAVRVNECSERPSGLLKTRLSQIGTDPMFGVHWVVNGEIEKKNSDFKAFLGKEIQFSWQPLDRLSWVTFVKNKAWYTATPVACGWAGAIIEVSGTFGQEQ